MSARRDNAVVPGRDNAHTSILRIVLAGALGIVAALLISCGGSSAKLIPLANAGPLQSDFETIAQDAEAGNGSCTSTEAAILKTDQDFQALPASIDSGLRQTLRQGIENLRARALVLCAQPLAQTTPTNTTPKTTKTETTPTTSTNTTTTTTETTPTTTTPSTTPTTTTTPGGGTPAPGVGETPPAGGGTPGGGTGAGEGASNPGEGAAGAGVGNGNGNANGQEGTQ